MLPSKRDRKTGYIYRLRKKLESQIDKECNAELANISNNLASDSEDEQDSYVSTTTIPVCTSLKMTCSDSEDSLEVSANGSSISMASRIQNHSDIAEKSKSNETLSREPTITKVLNVLTLVSKRVKKMHGATDYIFTEVGTISNRLLQIEEKVDASITSLDKMKNVLTKSFVSLGNQERPESLEFDFDFKKVSNEEEFLEFDYKLGNDKEYYSKVRKWLTMQFKKNNPDNRMHIAMDLVFERTFMPLCCWTGRGRGESKIAFKTRTNILKLFADIGSNKFTTVNGLLVQKFFKKKFPHAKSRLNLTGTRTTLCRKRRVI
ncbi:uncharacterized protein LOC125771078 [Anopheles funestus]|uniref:uncharacterized protein LOC125771078 n=1 Tax=Anopheles funestus TaxID=62324 RepID=UPI0020C61E29|nr:uncharacterized protein LOC125771078 [Anopheles funestus]